MESSVLHDDADSGGGKQAAGREAAPKAGAPPQHTAYEVPEAFRGAPRFMNIPELPSASAEWHGPKMRAIFVLTLVVSIFEIVMSLPLSLALVGILAVVAGILGIIAASNNLCESCQGPVMDSNVAVVRLVPSRKLAMWFAVVAGTVAAEKAIARSMRRSQRTASAVQSSDLRHCTLLEPLARSSARARAAPHDCGVTLCSR